jgi:hypothetical protein
MQCTAKEDKPCCMPQKEEGGGNSKQAEINKFDNYVICGTVNEFHVAECQCSTLKALLPILKNRINLQGYTRAL